MTCTVGVSLGNSNVGVGITIFNCLVMYVAFSTPLYPLSNALSWHLLALTHFSNMLVRHFWPCEDLLSWKPMLTPFQIDLDTDFRTNIMEE